MVHASLAVAPPYCNTWAAAAAAAGPGPRAAAGALRGSAGAAFLVTPVLLQRRPHWLHPEQQQQQQQPQHGGGRQQHDEASRCMASPGGTRRRRRPLQATKVKVAPPPAAPAPAAAPAPGEAPTAPPRGGPRRLVARPLVDARQLDAAEVEQRFPGVDFDVPRTMDQALRTFLRQPSIQIIIGGLVALAGARLQLGAGPSALELLAVPLTVAGWVVQEWAIHRFLLHEFTGWPGGAIHQAHHELPFYHVSIDPPPIVLAWGAVACALGLALLPRPLAWTVLGTYWLMGLAYEWSHYIAHTRVRPATRLGRAIKEHHTRHHLRDDRFWFAFSWPPIDGLLGTLPPAPGTESSRGGGAAEARG